MRLRFVHEKENDFGQEGVVAFWSHSRQMMVQRRASTLHAVLTAHRAVRGACPFRSPKFHPPHPESGEAWLEAKATLSERFRNDETARGGNHIHTPSTFLSLHMENKGTTVHFYVREKVARRKKGDKLSPYSNFM